MVSTLYVEFRPARAEDASRLEAIRSAAFAPVFASFRSILGDELYDLAQRREDEAQEALLASLLASDSTWELYVAHVAGELVGYQMKSGPLPGGAQGAYELGFVRVTE